MNQPKTIEEVRTVLGARKQEIISRFSARGVGIGKGADGRHVIVVYLEDFQSLPDGPVEVDGVPLKFEKTGNFRIQ